MPELNKVEASKLISKKIEFVTCIECCKYYIAPKTAPCGHTLCHGCWYGRRFCPSCSAAVNRKDLKVNNFLNSLTQHVQTLANEFERTFKIKIDEFMFDSPFDREESKRGNDVNNWLSNSQNHFSVPPTNSHQSTQDVVKTIKLTTSKIQVHSDTKKNTKNTHNKIVHVSQPSQHDWDKIEILSEGKESNTKTEEHIIGPMDIEPFNVNEIEYNNENPRRSSRKRIFTSDKNIHVKTNQSSEMHSGEVIDTNKRLQKVKSNWNNVKTMKNEFNKLKKIKKPKLNVSIETINTQNIISKSSSDVSINAKSKIKHDKNTDSYQISIPEEIIDTSRVPQNNELNLNDSNLHSEDKKRNEKNKIENNETEYISVFDEISQEKNKPPMISHECENVKALSNFMGKTNTLSKQLQVEKEKCDVHVVDSPFDDNLLINLKPTDEFTLSEKEKDQAKIPFFKKSVILDTENTKFNNEASTSDDIEISIKIGNSIAKITIKKKENDVQLNINKHCAVQASLGPHCLNTNHKLIDQETQVLLNEKLDSYGDVNINKNASRNIMLQNTNTETEKNATLKQRTASADTDTAQFEITESVEKELSDEMECVESQKKSEISAKNKKQPANKKGIYSLNLNTAPENIEDLNDLDLFDDATIKEPNVVLLKNAKHNPSQILPSSVKSTNFTTQKHSDKRLRETVSREDYIPATKKMRISSQNKNINKDQSENSLQDSAPIIYDQVMSQVFANIDADIENNKKSESEVNVKENRCADRQFKTQTIQENQVIQAEKTNYLIEKHSENMFSLVEKDTHEEIMLNKKNEEASTDTQKKIENLLTPGMCRELTCTEEENNQVEDVDLLENIIATPLGDDDSDKSIVEETPQKKTSFSKVSHKSDSKIMVNYEKQDMQKSESANRKKDISTISSQSVYTLNSTHKSMKEKNTTAINAKDFETPKSLNIFSDQIKHKSTPHAKKSLNFRYNNDTENQDIDPDLTLCPTTISLVGKTTQEKEFMSKAFEQTPKSPLRRPLMLRNVKNEQNICIAGSCLTMQELKKAQLLCHQRKWRFTDKYTKDLTHLVVGVDEENKAQRSVKYMCALAAGKWIVNNEWVNKCLNSKEKVDEAPYEALDSTGESGPTYSRLAKKRLFEGITFCCIPPFSILDVDTLKMILQAAGGRVVADPRDACAAEGLPALVLGEPESTQESRFMYLAMEMGVVPVNFEWALNCLGSYSLLSVQDLLLCPASLLPAATASWPSPLMAREDSATF